MVNSIIIETSDISMCFDVRYLKSLTFEQRTTYGLNVYKQCLNVDVVPSSVEASIKEAFQKVDDMETPPATSVTVEYVDDSSNSVSLDTPSVVEPVSNENVNTADTEEQTKTE